MVGGDPGRSPTVCERWEDRLPRTVPVEMTFPRIERRHVSITRTLNSAQHDRFVVPSTADVGDVRFALYTQEEAAEMNERANYVDVSNDTFASPVLYPLQGVVRGSPVVRMLRGAAQSIAGKMQWKTLRPDTTASPNTRPTRAFSTSSRRRY